MGTLLAETPALPLHTAGKYVAAVYIVLFLVVLIYVAIMALRLSRIERDLGEMLEMADSNANETKGPGSPPRPLDDGGRVGAAESGRVGNGPTAAGAPR